MRSPAFSNGLHSHGPDAEGSIYYFVIDTLVAPPEGTAVWQHEVAHRAFTRAGVLDLFGTSLDLVRELVRTSHLLLSVVIQLLDRSETVIRGSRIGALTPISTDTRTNSALTELLQRLQRVEGLIDSAWRPLAPMAELAAVDFSEGISKRFSVSYLKRQDLSPEERLQVDEQKRHLVDLVAREYPWDFGGYHLVYGSFQKAMMNTWESLNLIADDEIREDILRLSMSVIGQKESGELFYVDPIKFIHDASLAYADLGREVRRIIFKRREEIADMASRLEDTVQRMCSGIEKTQFIDPTWTLDAVHWEQRKGQRWHMINDIAPYGTSRYAMMFGDIPAGLQSSEPTIERRFLAEDSSLAVFELHSGNVRLNAGFIEAARSVEIIAEKTHPDWVATPLRAGGGA